MKTLFGFLIIICFFLSCKKEDPAPKICWNCIQMQLADWDTLKVNLNDTLKIDTLQFCNFTKKSMQQLETDLTFTSQEVLSYSTGQWYWINVKNTMICKAK
jgi:hypothetical protein